MKYIELDMSQQEKMEQLSRFYDEPISDLIAGAIDVMFSFTFEGEVDHGFQKRKDAFRYCTGFGENSRRRS